MNNRFMDTVKSITAGKYRSVFIYSALILATLAVFWQVHSFEFLNYDDIIYVSRNNHIVPGLTREGIEWIFIHGQAGNWHPLTGLSHMLDCQLFDLKPGLHHLVNLLFHIANTLLLFAVLRRMTSASWQSAFVAALFAFHPLHVESVAWVSERKDVLSTLFWLLTIGAYFRYIKNPTAGRYTLTLVLFALGLMSKPMLVTLPFTLLLLDYWPLERTRGQKTEDRRQIYFLIIEKIPFFILSAVSSVVTFLVQKSGGALRQTEVFPMTIRLSNAVISYAKYMAKMIWPSRLTAFYPYTAGGLPYREVFASAVVLSAITTLVIRAGGKYKYLPTGWFWFLGTLVPVIGIVQVGDQSMADRYSYVPFIGLFIIIAWGANDLLAKYRFRRIVLAVASVIVISALSVCTWFQTGYWRNSRSLFEHAIKVTSNNYKAYNNLGFVMFDKGNFDEAINDFKNVIKIRSDYVPAYNNLGAVYTSIGRYREAMASYKEALRIKPDSAEVYNNLGAACANFGRSQEAMDAYKRAISLKPDYADAHYNLGLSYLTAGDKNSAMEEYKILKTLDAQKAATLLKAIGN